VRSDVPGRGLERLSFRPFPEHFKIYICSKNMEIKIQRAVERILLDIALETLETLKRVAFTSGRETQAIDLVRTKFETLLQKHQEDTPAAGAPAAEDEDDLEKMIEDALVNA
jgi:hypothetical protein